jgi:hypothetical protein
MAEFEDGLRDAMREAQRDPDEAFVALVSENVKRLDAWRIVGLSLAAGAAVVLIAMLAVVVGPALAQLLRMPVGAPVDAPRFLWIAAPVAGVLLVGAVAVPLLRRR